METLKVFLLYEDKETGYYGSRYGIGGICGIFSSYEEAQKANKSNYLCIKEFTLNKKVDSWTPYDDIKLRK